MTDELAHALSQLPGLRLAGRTSSYSFKGKAVNARDIGRTLDVAGIVEGTVRRSGDRLRVTASLTSTTDGKQRWSKSYESTAKDVFTVQDSLTKAMVAAIVPALRGEQATNVAERTLGTSNAAAYDDYLKGRHFWELRGTDNLLRAVDNFSGAIRRDPKFGRAYAGLAMSLVVLPGYTGDPADTLVSAGVSAAKRALTLDSTLLDAKTALAYADNATLEPELAEARYLDVLRDDPQNVTVRQRHGDNLLALGRIDDAIKELKYATTLDPLSAVVQSNLVYALWTANRFDESARAASRVFELRPDFSDPALISSYLFTGQADSALYYLTRMRRADSSALYIRGMFALAYAIGGRWNDYDKIAAAALSGPNGVGALEAGLIALAAGDPQPLGRALGTKAGQREWNAAFISLKCAPLLAPLRDDKKLADIVGTGCPATNWRIPSRPK